jgi:hypothetical protein
MTEWITGWKKIAQYLDVSIRTAQNKKHLPVYKNGGVRAKPDELDKYIKNETILRNSA